MSYYAETRDLSPTISGSEKLAAANSRRDVVTGRSWPIYAAAVDRAPSPEKLAAANSCSNAAMDKAGSGTGDPAGYIPAGEKLAAANFRSGSTSRHGSILAESVLTAWRRAA
ncbi:hypothetical protein mvi_63680 (plasmid) [Methylobacterium indicum]|uniref:Uncharacterized protein n=1 Tax=Methylobacterium indicum TaxID=1775910 RepID=A0A8H8X110_9HYPH|nr:hypothetical protein mvi_63680 [Methylobacterium indicum]